MATLPKWGARNYVFYYILISSVYLHVCHFSSSAENKNPVCTTPECQKLGEYYKKIMNPRANPCEDFYDYVCHGWPKENPRPKFRSLWAVHEELGLRTLYNLKKLLENNRTSGNKDEENAKWLFRSCMKLPSLERTPADALKKMMQKVGNWPMFLPHDIVREQNISWQYVDKEYIKIAGESALFDYYLKADTGNSSFDIRLVVKRPFSMYGMLKRETNWNDKNELKHYKAFLMKVINAVAPINPSKFKSEIEKDVDDVIQFREEIRRVTSANAWGFELMILDHFQRHYDRATGLRSTAKIDWLTVLRSIYKDAKDSYGHEVNGNSVINLQLQYFLSLAAILENTPPRVIGNHIHLYFAERHLILTKDMESDLEKSVVDGANSTGTVLYEPDRWLFCLANKEIDVTITRMFLNAYFSVADRAAVNHMVLTGNSILQRQIAESTWVNPLLEKIWIEKYDHLKAQIGYPDWYFNNFTQSPAKSSDIHPSGTDIHYVPILNIIGISAGYLQWPIYDSKLPYVITYGALLPTVGHELYHGLYFTDFNVETKVLKNDKVQQKMNEEFEKRAKCFRDQFTESRLKEIKKHKLSKKINFPPTLNEDIPDVMGLKLGYRGYQDKLWLSNGTCQVLPGFEEFSCDKLFFIAFGTSLCADLLPAVQQHLLVTDEHNLPQVRVNGAVQNMEEFAHAFSCKSSNALVPSKRCDLWD